MEGKTERTGAICPNCAQPVATHELFNPPRCPVVRIRWPRYDSGAITSCASTSGELTKEALDKAFAAIRNQRVGPRHDCRFDGHVMQWNPLGFNFCIHCNVSEADERGW